MPKEVKTGDVLDLTKKDMIFINECFSTANDAETSAVRFMSRAKAEAEKAWKTIVEKWPKLGKYHLTVDRENKCMVVRSEKGTLRSET